MFTFVVTCYNQADVVSHMLESIKYQIVKFGQGQTFQLIVTDDGSTDNSCEIIRRWLKENEGLFVKINLLFRKENAGICINYVEALRQVEGERFVAVNGDDLLAPDDLFEITAKLEESDIVCTAFLKFTGEGDIVRNYGTYLEVALQAFIRGKTLYRAIRLGFPIMGTAVYRKSLLSESVLNFILRFRTVNDRACFQKILDENKNIRVCYVNRPIILYRISATSISNFSSPTRVLHNREVAGLCRIEREKEKSPIFRLLLLVQEKSAVFRTSPSYYVRLLRFFSPYFAIMLWLYMRHYGGIRRLERQLVDEYWEVCREHYGKMADLAAAKQFTIS
ncbi:MAG TPA: hypothetical protein DCZ91_01265 [Lachnospiraceae bacterium]|nr:hypothetical protein [Lachnospiraceae bacterium]